MWDARCATRLEVGLLGTVANTGVVREARLS